MLTLLLDRGLDIDYRVTTRVPLYVQRDPWGSDYYVQERMTALHTAAKKGNKDAVRFLISRGAKRDVPDFHKDTARDHEVVEIFDQVGDPQCDGKKTRDTK
ncbi:hypothetical protein NPX13_g5950 [Xylaria arbuscula]|uniref:Uncharacterized protein n=1 Tax=Xylaria arbuscula TaxID=114810 RepID=A0A9W8NDH8_9PEZI|nr:hypothetical protein NPX13_g5950 [Xylaria arbuscula]